MPPLFPRVHDECWRKTVESGNKVSLSTVPFLDITSRNEDHLSRKSRYRWQYLDSSPPSNIVVEVPPFRGDYCFDDGGLG